MYSKIARINLAEAPSERRLKVLEINAGADIRKRLSVMGLHVDDVLIKQTWAKWGPVLVENISNGSAKMAIGRGLADKIMVEF